MDAAIESTRLRRLLGFLMHRLFHIHHQRIRNGYLVLLADLLELAALMFYLLGGSLQLPGPIFHLYSQVVQPLMVFGWDSAGSSPYIPAAVLALNTLVLLSVGLMSDRLNSPVLQLLQLYLFAVPVLYVDEVLALLNVINCATKISEYSGAVIVLAVVGGLASALVIVLALYLRGKLHRLYEIVLIACIKFQANKWVIMALLVLKLLAEWLVFRTRDRWIDSVQLFIGAFLTLVNFIALISGQSSYCNDTIVLICLALVVPVAARFSLLSRSTDLRRLVSLFSSEDSYAIVQQIEQHIAQCLGCDCVCRKIENTEYSPDQTKELLIKIATSLHERRSDKTSNDYFEYAEYCMEHLNYSFKGLSSMCQHVRPKGVIEKYRYMSICVRYEIEARSVKDNEKAFRVGAGQARNLEEELSKFREMFRELVSDMKVFWLEVKMDGMSEQAMHLLSKFPQKINEFERVYKSLSAEFDDNRQLQLLYKVFQQRIVNKQSYTDTEQVIIPKVSPFIISREQRIVKFNHQFCQVYGWQDEDIINQGVDMLMPKCFQNYHSKWVQDYIDREDIHVNKGQDSIKTVMCGEGYIRLADSKVQILPRFEQGIEILLFLVPVERKGGQRPASLLLANISDGTLLGCDQKFLQSIDLGKHQHRTQTIIQEAKLPQLLPLFIGGQNRMREELKLSSNGLVQTRLDLSPIICLLKLPPLAHSNLAINIEYVPLSNKPEISNLRLIRISVMEKPVEQKEHTVGSSLKNLAEHATFKPQPKQAESYNYRSAWWLLLGPSLLCFLFRLRLDALGQLSYLEGKWYSFVTLYLDSCLDVARYLKIGLTPIQLHMSQLYQVWMEYGVGSSLAFNLISNILRGNSSPDDYQSFLAVMAARPLMSEQSRINDIVDGYSSHCSLLNNIGIGLLVACVAFILVDLAFNIQYILLVEDKARQITEVLSLVNEKEVDHILMGLFTIEQAFGKETFDNYNCEPELQCATSGAPLLNFEDQDVQAARASRAESKLSIDAMSVMLHAFSVKKEESRTSILSSLKLKKRRANADETPSLLMSCNASMNQVMCPQAATSVVDITTPTPKTDKNSRQRQILKPILFLVLLGLVLICGLICQFQTARNGGKWMSQAITFQNILSWQYPILQQEAALMYLGVPSHYESEIDGQLNLEQSSIGFLGAAFSDFKMLWEKALNDKTCTYFLSQDSGCLDAEDGAFQLGQKIIFSNLIRHLRKLSETRSLPMQTNPAYTAVETILKLERSIYTNLTSTISSSIGSFGQLWSLYNTVTVSIVLFLCFLYILLVRLILQGFRKRISRSKHLLQIIPGAIRNSNEKISKVMQSY